MAEEMLILGDQEVKADFPFPSYQTLDIHGDPDILHDLTTPLGLKFQTVFNYGTLEHIWDYHSAFINTIDSVEVGGCYIGHHPVSGWEKHGIHITNQKYIAKFLKLNGFLILDEFFTAYGKPCSEPQRDCGNSIVYWVAARKIQQVPEYKTPRDLCL